MTHLTSKQKQHIFDTAVKLLRETVAHDVDYMDFILRQYVSSYRIEAQLDMISSDEDCQTDLLGFDPQTGKAVVR